MPAPVANYCVEQGRGVFRGALCHSLPLLGRQQCLNTSEQYSKLSQGTTLWNLGRKSGKKNGLNLSDDLFLWSSSFSSGFYPPFQIFGYAPPLPPFRKSCIRHGNRSRQAISLGPYPACDLKDLFEIPIVTSGNRWPRYQILL